MWVASDKKIIVVAIGLAVSVMLMHYIGMWAQAGKFEMEWEFGTIAGTFALAMAVCFIGLKVLFEKRIVTSVSNNMLCGVVIGLAVSSVHYTGVQAATYKYKANGIRDTTISIWNNDFGSVYFVLALGITKFLLGICLHAYDRYIKVAVFGILEKELYDRCIAKAFDGESVDSTRLEESSRAFSRPESVNSMRGDGENKIGMVAMEEQSGTPHSAAIFQNDGKLEACKKFTFPSKTTCECKVSVNDSFD